MKKIICLITFCLLFLTLGTGASAASDQKGQYPTDKEIEALNKELDQLVEEANKKLERGEKNVEVSSKNLKLGFKEINTLDPVNLKGNQLNSTAGVVTAAAIGSKSYQAYVSNTAGFNFSHAVSGVFSWNGDILTALSGSADTSGPMYDRSTTTTKEALDGRMGIDAKVGRVVSKGTFKALKYLKAYYTTLIVDVYAPTQSYRIIEADIDA